MNNSLHMELVWQLIRADARAGCPTTKVRAPPSDLRECRSSYPVIAPFPFLSLYGELCRMLAAHHHPKKFYAEMRLW